MFRFIYRKRPANCKSLVFLSFNSFICYQTKYVPPYYSLRATLEKSVIFSFSRPTTTGAYLLYVTE